MIWTNHDYRQYCLKRGVEIITRNYTSSHCSPPFLSRHLDFEINPLLRSRPHRTMRVNWDLQDRMPYPAFPSSRLLTPMTEGGCAAIKESNVSWNFPVFSWRRRSSLKDPQRELFDISQIYGFYHFTKPYRNHIIIIDNKQFYFIFIILLFLIYIYYIINFKSFLLILL